MHNWKRFITFILATAVLCAGCAKRDLSGKSETLPVKPQAQTEPGVSASETSLSTIDSTGWNYNEADNVYWQVQVQYCENPADLQYETLGIFVPGAYMNAVENGDGTYTCEVNEEGVVGGYTAMDAPIVIPVDTPGYMAMSAPTGYVSSASSYTDAGFIYVNAGCRGRDAGAPAGVTDLKAAVRYIRYSADVIPGSTERIFTFGMSGGGAQSALMGATGDSDLYTPYLEAIGAVQGYSDAIAGAMCWCPVTNLDCANEAYEWNMGSTRTNLNDEMQALSDNMAVAFAEYINDLGLTDSDGNVLVLEQSEDGIYQAGSYYEYMKNVIEQSLNNFLADTTFPYTVFSSGGRGGMGDFGGRGDFGNMDGFGGRGALGDLEDVDGKENLGRKGEIGDKEDLPGGMEGGRPAGNMGGFIDENGEFQDDGINRIDTDSTQQGGTYETAQDYIDSLNADGEWIIYDSAANTATISSVADFAAHCKAASKNVGSFDDLSATQGENVLFGYGDGQGAHFDPIMAELLAGTEYEAAYAEDLSKTDALGNTVDIRMNMYNPMYFLADYYEGYQTANVAQYWRIRTGINQGDTALCTEVDLALALVNYGVDVDFATVWGMAHTMAERTGEPTANFVAWVNDCLLH